MGENEFKPHPQNEILAVSFIQEPESLLGISFKNFDDHPRHFYMGVSTGHFFRLVSFFVVVL